MLLNAREFFFLNIDSGNLFSDFDSSNNLKNYKNKELHLKLKEYKVIGINSSLLFHMSELLTHEG